MRLDVGFHLAEGPVWDDECSCLYFVDITAGDLIIRPDCGSERRIHVDDFATSVHLCDRHDVVLVTTRDALVEVDVNDGSMTPVISLSLSEGMRFNDGAVAPDGSLWMGTMRIAPPRGGDGALYRITRDGWSVMLEGCTIPNGLVFIDNGEFVHVESGEDRISRYRIGCDFKVERISSLVLEGQCPDGMCAADDGTLLVALWNTGELALVDVDDMKLIQRMDGFHRPLSCPCIAQGGRCFLTSAEGEEGSGCHEVVDVDMKAKEVFRWHVE